MKTACQRPPASHASGVVMEVAQKVRLLGRRRAFAKAAGRMQELRVPPPGPPRRGAAPGLLFHPGAMWNLLSYRCDVCHAFTLVPSKVEHPGTCARCHRPLDLAGHPHRVAGLEAGEAIRDSPVPVVLVFTGKWSEAPPQDHQAVESLAHALSGEVTVLLADVVEDATSATVWSKQGRPRAVLLSKGNELGRGANYPAEEKVRFVLSRALPPAAGEPSRAAA